MIDIAPTRHLQWQGADTIPEVAAALDRTRRIEIQLAASYNHTLYSLFHPDASPSDVETLALSGDSGLVEKLAVIPGLEAFADLVPPLSRAGAEVQLVSPPRVIIDVP